MTAQPTDILYGALKMYQPDEGQGQRVNVDTVLLAHFVRMKRFDLVIELGCAHGGISLILAARRKQLSPTDRPLPLIQGLEIQSELTEMAERNAELNGLAELVAFRNGDLRRVREYYQSGTFNVVVVNPPYDEQVSSNPSPLHAMAAARSGTCCTLADVASASRYLLKNGGRLFIVIRAKRMAELMVLLNGSGLTPKRLRAVHPKPDRQASVVLVEARRAGGEGMVIEPPLYIYGPDGVYTPDLLAAYQIGAEERCS